MSGFPYNLPPDGRNENGHQGTDQVEEAEGCVGERGDGKDGGLRHAATGPGEKWRGDGGGVLHGTAEEALFIAPVAEGSSEYVGSQQDRKVLIRYDAVERCTCDHGRCYQSGAGSCKRVQ